LKIHRVSSRTLAFYLDRSRFISFARVFKSRRVLVLTQSALCATAAISVVIDHFLATHPPALSTPLTLPFIRTTFIYHNTRLRHPLATLYCPSISIHLHFCALWLSLTRHGAGVNPQVCINSPTAVLRLVCISSHLLSPYAYVTRTRLGSRMTLSTNFKINNGPKRMSHHSLYFSI
jgi:hypothetical protein